ncbi:Regulatory protein SoxS [Posidoniimonas polymericola]|uniref:Regulatory protein SoxS n=1 Tax=Posidoniimonas polymericola TaxID=2528002 RepID=A0A5C5YMC4_9BACT|nr:AraC family transcriptional regulator [Posidoniimonas polymericola]TWT75979.1 Regulatory protein SoxS [Posidoniimonas polymericola]
MGVYRETIETPADQSFRLLYWEHSLAEVQTSTGPEQWEPITGSGERWHAHRAVELTYIHRGAGTRFIGDHIGAINPPELVLIGADLPHYWRGLDDSEGAAVQFALAPAAGLGALPELSALSELWSHASRGAIFGKELAIEIGGRLARLRGAGSVKRLAELMQVVSLLADGLTEANTLCDKPCTITASAAHADKIRDAIDLLLEHHHEPLRIDDIAQAVGLSRATLCRYFRRYTGRSVVAFLNEARIDHARRRLLETADAVSQIALDVGFENLSNFNRQFRRAAGASPREFRRQEKHPRFDADQRIGSG